jgi:hypothetical protein
MLENLALRQQLLALHANDHGGDWGLSTRCSGWWLSESCGLGGRNRSCSSPQGRIEAVGKWPALGPPPQALKMYDAAQERIAAYEQEILRKLHEMEQGEPPQPTAPPLQNANKAKMIKKRGQETKRQALYRMSGVDMTQIDAIGVETVEVVVSEYGSDLSRFPTEKQFVSHATLAPRVPKSGGKPVKKKKRNSVNTRVAAALRMAALSLRHSHTALGAYYRRIAQRRGGDIAVFATARKLATLIYRLLRWGQPYVDEGAAAFENRYRELRIGRLAATARQLGYQLTPVSA